MKIELSQNELRAAMERASHVIAKRSYMPILSHVLLEATDHAVRIHGTDLNTSVTCVFNGASTRVLEPDSVCLDAKQLLTAAKTGGKRVNERVQIDVQNNTAVVRVGTAAKYTIAGCAGEDYPMMTPVPDKPCNLVVDAPRFLARMAALAPMLSGDETRPHHTGMALQRTVNAATDKHELMLGATNGHMLGVWKRPTEPGTEFKVILESGLVDVLLHEAKTAKGNLRVWFRHPIEADQPAGITAVQGRAWFVFDNGVTYSGKLVSERWPSYEQVQMTDGEHTGRLTVNREKLLAACALIPRSGYGKSKVKGARVAKLDVLVDEFDDTVLTLSSANPDNQMSVDVLCESSDGFAPYSSIDTVYLSHVLEAMPDATVTLLCRDLEVKNGYAALYEVRTSYGFTATIMGASLKIPGDMPPWIAEWKKLCEGSSQ